MLMNIFILSVIFALLNPADVLDRITMEREQKAKKQKRGNLGHFPYTVGGRVSLTVAMVMFMKGVGLGQW